MINDSQGQPLLSSDSVPLSTTKEPSKWSWMLFLLGLLYLLVGSNEEFQECVGSPLGNIIRTLGLGIVIWAGVSLKRSKPVRARMLFIVAILSLFVVGLVFVFSPDLAAAHAQRGNAYASQGQFDKAIDEFTIAIACNPKLAGALQPWECAHATP